jgi:FtsP/CotA-like multicopper oxidase with cupredoxin domain
VWEFDYDGGLWTINGQVMDPNRIDAGIEQGTAEIWTFRNGGTSWSHPIHSHFTEFLLLEVNGTPYLPTYIQDWSHRRPMYLPLLSQSLALRGPIRDFEVSKAGKPVRRFMGGLRRDVATLLPGDEIKVYMRWNDFLGKHVMHCHNVVHEDHAMMIRWDIVKPGKGFDKPQPASKVYRETPPPPHLEERPASPTIQDDQG